MSNGLYTQNNQLDYEILYDEWLETVRGRHPRIASMPDNFIWKYGKQRYGEESSRVQHPSDYALEIEKTSKFLDEQTTPWIPHAVRMTAQKAVNESLIGGLGHLAETGEMPYPLIDKNTGKPYDFNVLQKAASIVASFVATPADLIFTGMTGGFGKLVGTAIIGGTRKAATNRLTNSLIKTGMSKKLAGKEASQRVADRFSEKHFPSLLKKGWTETLVKQNGKKFTTEIINPQPFLKRWSHKSASTAGLLTGYHMLGKASEISLERGERLPNGKWVPGELTKEDIPAILYEGGVGMASGFALGAIQTAVGANIVGKSGTTQKLMTAGEWGSEVAIFGSLPNILRGQLPNLNDEGELVWTQNGKPIQFQDEDGIVRDFSVKEGMKHAAFTIASLKTWGWSSNKISKYVGDKWRGRGSEIKKLESERKTYEDIIIRTDSEILKIELNRQKDKTQRKINSLKKEEIEGFDESSYENILKIEDAIYKRKVPNKSTVEKAEVELEDLKAHIHEVRSKLEKGEELPQNIKDLSKARNSVEQYINAMKERGWKDGSKNIVDTTKSEADRKASLEADFDTYLEQKNKIGQAPKWSTIEELLEYYKDVDKAQDYFNRYFDRQNPKSASEIETDKKLDKININLEKLTKDPKSEEQIKKAETDLPSESIELINAENISDVDKGFLKSLLLNIESKADKTKPSSITTLIGETRGFAKWLNTQGKNLSNASQALFDNYMEGRSLSAGAKERYTRQFKTLGLDIDVSRVPITVKKEKIILTTKEYQDNVKKTKETLKGEGDVDLSSKVKMPKSMARVIMNLKSRWGHRDNIFKRTVKEGGAKVGDVETDKKGTPYGITVTEKGEIPVFRFLEPELSKDIKSLMKGKKDNDLLFSLDGKKPLSQGNMDNFNVKFISYGKEGVTGHKIRHFLISAAKVLDKKNKNTEFSEFVDRFLLLHPPGKGSEKLSPSAKHYILEKESILEDFKTFNKFHTQLEKMKNVDFNKVMTKAERERISEEISAIIGGKGKVDVKVETEIVGGSKDALQRLKDSGALDIDMGLSIQDVGKGKGKIRFEFNNKNPNYSLKDKLADAALVGAEIIAQGTKTLKDFTAQMQARFGPTVNKYVKQLYEASSNVLAQSPERLAPNVMKKLGIKKEDIISDIPEIEANKIIKQIKAEKYDDAVLDKKIIKKQIIKIAYKKGLTDKKLNDEVFESLGFYDKNGKPSIEGIKTQSDLTDVFAYLKENYPDFAEPLQLEISNIVQNKHKLRQNVDSEWRGYFKGEFKSNLLPVSRFIKMYGGAPGKLLGKKMDAFMNDYYHLVGFGDLVRDSAKKLGLTDKEIDMLSLADREVFSSRLTIEQERFQHDMFNSPNSAPYKAREIINDMFATYDKILRERVKKVANPRDFEKLDKWLTKRMVKEYFTRRVTKEASDYYQHDNEGRTFVEKAIRKHIYKEIVSKDKKYIGTHIKIKSLEKKLKDPDILNKDIVEKELKLLRLEREARQKKLEKDNKVISLQEKFYDQWSHNPDKLIHPNLDFVRLDLPEFIPSGKHAGKRMYEMKFDATVGGYINSSSRFISAISHFPSLTSWGGKRVKTKYNNQLLNIYSKKGSGFGTYVEKQIRNLVIGSNSPDNVGFNKVLSGWTQFGAITGLSSFFSGIKNFQIGDIMNFATFGMGSFLKEYRHGFTSKGWTEARKIGAFQAGSKHLHEIGLSKPVMKKLSLMEPAEHSNRARSYATGMSWLTDALRHKRGERTLWLRRMGSEKWVDFKLKNTFEMDKKDIDFFTKYGLDANLIPLDTPNYNKVIDKHGDMMRHLATRTHVATQGATSVADLPSWMNQGFWKYGTLFYRMAYKTAENTHKNVFKPLILKNPLPLFRLVSMGVGHGTLLWQIKHTLMGTEMNHEHMKGEVPSKLWEATMAVETFSLFGSAANATGTDEGRGLMQEFLPVILTNLVNIGTLGSQLYDVTTGKYTKTARIKAFGQSFDDYAKKTVVAYNHWSKIRDNLLSGSTGKEIVRYRQAAKIIRTFKEDKKASWTGSGSWNKPLYKALEREILLASGKDSKSMTSAAELYWVARMELREKLLEEYDFKISHKKADNMARKQLEPSIKNRLGVVPFSMFSITGQIKREQLFNAIDKQGAYILRKAEADAKSRLDIFYKQVRNINSDDRYTNW